MNCLKKIAALLICANFFQYTAFADTNPTIENLTIDTFDEVLKWDVSGTGYTGAEVYKVTEAGELEYFGSTDTTVIAYGDEGTYLVKPVNAAEKYYGSIISYSESEPFVLNLNDISYSKNSVSMDISVVNNSGSYSGGVLDIRVLDVEGKSISHTENNMVIKTGKTNRLKISQLNSDKRYKLIISFWDTAESQKDLALPIVIVKDNPSVEYTEEVITVNDANAAEILTLINRCKNNNIPTDYEYANYKILKRFSEYLKQDIKNNEFGRVYYTENALYKIYRETVDNLNAYLSGEKTSVAVPEYKTSDMRLDGETAYAMTEVDGSMQERPVYFVGYGHFDNAKSDVEFFEDLGMNTMQTEIGPANAMLYTPAFENWGVYENGTPSYTLTADTSVVNNALTSAKLTFSSEKSGTVRLFQKVKVEPGKSYTFSAYVRSDSKTTGVSCTADDFENKLNINGQYGWKKVTKSYQAPVGVVYTTVGFEVTSDAEFYVDNAVFAEKGSDVNLLINGDFEEVSDFEYSFDRYSENVLSVEDVLSRADESNISTCVLLSPHYFPKKILDIYNIGFENGTAFIKYNIHAPEAKKVIERFMRGIIPVINQYDSLSSICISNEPSFEIIRAGDYFADEWHQFLKDRYDNDISKLNAAYNYNYSSFENVKMNDRGRYNYDYIEFVDGIFADWHRWMAGISKEEAPDVPIHSKLMGYLAANSENMNTYHCGADYAEYHDFMDINGCDYSNYIDNDGKYLTQEMWYDYMRSVKNAPVINSEDHVIPNGDDNYDADVADYVGQNIYMGAIHGRVLSDIWVWERDYDAESKFADSILFRPDVISSVSKNAMLLNKNAYQINALQTKSADIGILYSKSSVLLDKTAMNSLYQAYSACIYNGVKPGFVISSQLEKLNDYEVVIIPDTKYVTPEILSAITEYQAKGGKLIVMGDESFKYNDMRGLNDASVVSEIHKKADKVDYVALKNGIYSSSETEFYSLMRNKFIENGLCNVEVRDRLTGKPAEYVQINVAEYNGKVILNMLSYDGRKNVDVYINGSKVESADNILTSETLTDITLNKYIPVTLLIDADM